MRYKEVMRISEQFIVEDKERKMLGVLVAPGRRYWVPLTDLPESILYKLAALGLKYKLRRIVSRGNRSPEEREQAIAILMANLQQGRWQATLPRRKEVTKEQILNLIRRATPDLRPDLIRAMKASGVTRRLGITEDEWREVRYAPMPAGRHRRNW